MSRRIIIAIILIVIGVTIQMVAEKTKPLPLADDFRDYCVGLILRLRLCMV